MFARGFGGIHVLEPSPAERVTGVKGAQASPPVERKFQAGGKLTAKLLLIPIPNQSWRVP